MQQPLLPTPANDDNPQTPSPKAIPTSPKSTSASPKSSPQAPAASPERFNIGDDEDESIPYEDEEPQPQEDPVDNDLPNTNDEEPLPTPQLPIQQNED